MVLNSTDKFIQKFIVWIFPGILTVLGYLIYGEISGMRTDVKTLLVQQSATSEKLIDLEKRLIRVEDKVFPTQVSFTRGIRDSPMVPDRMPPDTKCDQAFTLPDNSQRKSRVYSLLTN